MVALIDKVGRVPAPPTSFVRLFQSGAISDEETVRFFSWLDKVIKNGHLPPNGSVSPASNGHVNIQDVLTLFFAQDRVVDLASRIRIGNGATSSTTDITSSPSIKANGSGKGRGKYSPDKKLTDYIKLDKPIVFFDVEVAGRNGDNRKIVEISLVKIHPDGKEENLDYKLNPEMRIEKELEDIHGINDNDVASCPKFREIGAELFKFVGDSHLGGFNIFTYDFNVLQKEFATIGLNFDKQGRAIIDPMKIYHKNVPSEDGKPRTLTAAYKHYCERDLENAHSSKPDIQATIEVLKGQFEKYPDLPRDINLLSEYCRNNYLKFVDKKGLFVWTRKKDAWEITFNFSTQHKGDTLKDVIQKDIGFVTWMLGKDFPEDTKGLLRNALKGIYPEPPS